MRRNGQGEHHRLYCTSRWQRIRATQLAMEPLCRMCMAMGVVTEARVCDHVEPHKGDVIKFHTGPFQSLCKPCHDSVKQREDLGKAAIGCDAEGIPFGRIGGGPRKSQSHSPL